VIETGGGVSGALLCFYVVVGQTIAGFGTSFAIAFGNYTVQASRQSLGIIRLKTVGMSAIARVGRPDGRQLATVTSRWLPEVHPRADDP
jgi:hypothetical protein